MLFFIESGNTLFIGVSNDSAEKWTFTDCTNVKMDIGRTLQPLMKEIIEADGRSDEVQIKISDYRSNMSSKVFEKGEPFQKLLDTLVAKAQEVLQR